MGTLKGNDSANQTVQVGDRDQLECDLAPPGTASQLDGQWRAYVDNVSVAIARIDEASGRAVIAPPDPPGYYENVGQVQVRCVLVSLDGEVITEFNRTVTVTGELFGCWCLAAEVHTELTFRDTAVARRTC